MTDNGSTDSTRTILDSYARQGRVFIIDEYGNNHDQAIWVTRMARLASTNFAADWVIHCDADEFWLPSSGNLKTELSYLQSDANVLIADRYNFIPPAIDSESSLPFYESQTIREKISRNSLGKRLPGKICHRCDSRFSISDGNHAVMLEGEILDPVKSDSIDILHFPVRSYAQFERKIREGTEALRRNRRISPSTGVTWQKIYDEYLVTGKLYEYYLSLRPNADKLKHLLQEGTLIEDDRLKDALVMK